MSAASNCFFAASKYPHIIPFIVAAFLACNILPGAISKKVPMGRLRVCHHGNCTLKIFAASTVISIIYHIVFAFFTFPQSPLTWVYSALICIAAEAVLFWNGIISVYCTSVQLGIKHRIIGIALGAIPIANLIALASIIRITSEEVRFESEKHRINRERKSEKICETKYPLLLVHGVFFRDSRYLNYWGRIPAELTANGATVYYGDQQSAASIEANAREIAERIKQIVHETGCEKVNIIAHSKGGLDCRYAISFLDSAPYVASLTTINTPHRGCEFADYLLSKIPQGLKNKIAAAYNTSLKKLGDKDPDFLAAVNELTYSHCAELDEKMIMPEGIYTQSFGSKLNRALGGKFPLNFTYHLVKYFDGANDGLVSEKSFSFGESYRLLTANRMRGISHGDMIDLNRENIPGFDIREFYVDLVNDLKKREL